MCIPCRSIRSLLWYVNPGRAWVRWWRWIWSRRKWPLSRVTFYCSVFVSPPPLLLCFHGNQKHFIPYCFIHGFPFFKQIHFFFGTHRPCWIQWCWGYGMLQMQWETGRWTLWVRGSFMVANNIPDRGWRLQYDAGICGADSDDWYNCGDRGYTNDEGLFHIVVHLQFHLVARQQWDW